MIRLPQAIVAVMACTIASGVAGGVVGAAVGRLAPSFVAWLHSPGGQNGAIPFDATEFGFGLGTVCGLFLGAGRACFWPACSPFATPGWCATACLSRKLRAT